MSLRIHRALNDGLLAGDSGIIAFDSDMLIFNLGYQDRKEGLKVIRAGLPMEGGIKVFEEDEAWNAHLVLSGGNAVSHVMFHASMRGSTTLLLRGDLSLGSPAEGEAASAVNNVSSVMSSLDLQGAHYEGFPQFGILMDAINNAKMEAYIWSALVLKASESKDIKKVILSVPQGQMLSTLDQPYRNSVEDAGDIEIEFEPPVETPGIDLKSIMLNEYFDAVKQHDGDLTHMKVCRRSASASCFGKDVPCTYDDYVIARIVGMCPSCHDEESLRSKFKVN